jgi:hypothetical protein
VLARDRGRRCSVLPLGLYLGTYLLCFASDRAYARSWCLPILVFALMVMAQATALGARAGVTSASRRTRSAPSCAALLPRRARRAPAAARHSTAYVLIALGGALAAPS